jgi:hypothetical protein
VCFVVVKICLHSDQGLWPLLSTKIKNKKGWNMSANPIQDSLHCIPGHKKLHWPCKGTNKKVVWDSSFLEVDNVWWSTHMLWQATQITCLKRGQRWPSSSHHVSWPWLYKKWLWFLFSMDPIQRLCPKSLFSITILGH